MVELDGGEENMRRIWQSKTDPAGRRHRLLDLQKLGLDCWSCSTEKCEVCSYGTFAWNGYGVTKASHKS